jgi:hypothetical protein
MRLRMLYGADVLAGVVPAEELPVAVEVDGAHVTVAQDEKAERRLRLTIDLPVTPEGLRLERKTGIHPSAESEEELPAIEVPETAVAGVVARRVADAVAFITRCPNRLFVPQERPALVPESEADSALLEQLGTTRVFQRMSSRPSVLTGLPLSDNNIAALYERAGGVRLYVDALRMGSSAAQLREYWRVFEAAFARKDRRLVALLSDCAAARDMEFTPDELEDLRTLRGRASHADSKAGIEEVAAVERQASEVIGRVRGLAEVLIVRKRDWGAPNAAVVEGLPPFPYARRDGTLVIFKRTAEQQQQ